MILTTSANLFLLTSHSMLRYMFWLHSGRSLRAPHSKKKHRCTSRWLFFSYILNSVTLFAPVILLKNSTICHLKGHFDILHNNGVLFYFIKSSVHVKITALFPTIFTSKDNFLFPSWPRLSRPVLNAMLLCFAKVPSQCVHRYWTLAVNRVCETDSKNKLGKKYII